jgi:hypothetical protein
MAENIVGPVVRGENCYGRQEKIRIIWDKLKTGNVLLAAPRRFGKTSIMYRLIDDPQPDFRIIHADLEHMTAPAQLLEELFMQLAKDSKLRGLLNDISTIPGRIWETVKQNISEVELYKVRLELRQSVGAAWQDIGSDLFKKIQQSNLENDFYLQFDPRRTTYFFSCKLLRDWWLRHYALSLPS